MTKDPSAILAVNSLDRYTALSGVTFNTFRCTYAANATTLTWLPTTVGGQINNPLIGAFIAALDGSLARNTMILAWDTVTNIVTISLPTIAAHAAPYQVLQTLEVALSSQPSTNFLKASYQDSPPYSHDFQIQNQTNLIYGYVNRIVISQIQIQYNIPTVNEGLNDTFYLQDYDLALPPQQVVIPHGFYYADELAAQLQVNIRANTAFSDMEVAFTSREGFVFTSASYTFFFPSITAIQLQLALKDIAPLTNSMSLNIYKTYTLLGMTTLNSNDAGQGPTHKQTSSQYPNFLYTPYIDIYSDTLTNYQPIKDTTTSTQASKGLVARIYLSGTGQGQTINPTAALGTAPFIMTADLNSPKIIKWSPDVALTVIDIQLRDQYGEFIPGAPNGFSTEFQMTLLFSEERD